MSSALGQPERHVAPKQDAGSPPKTSPNTRACTEGFQFECAYISQTPGNPTQRHATRTAATRIAGNASDQPPAHKHPHPDP